MPESRRRTQKNVEEDTKRHRVKKTSTDVTRPSTTGEWNTEPNAPNTVHCPAPNQFFTLDRKLLLQLQKRKKRHVKEVRKGVKESRSQLAAADTLLREETSLPQKDPPHWHLA
mmetsp:Transcript_3408/g.5349  ORF Transcript_3408/g.5349 Transcript_3408/m.5349 type:complete len:113 (-) Transcript_3408:61-399(-)